MSKAQRAPPAHCVSRDHIQCSIHLVKRVLRLLEVVPHEAATKLAVVLVHFQELLEHFNINHILWQRRRALLYLG